MHYGSPRRKERDREKEREREAESLFRRKKKMAENFPNLRREMDVLIHEAQNKERTQFNGENFLNDLV